MGISFVIEVKIFHEGNYSAAQELDDGHRISSFNYWHGASVRIVGHNQLSIAWLLVDNSPGPEFHHSPESSADVKNEWSYTYTTPYILKVSCLTKYRDKPRVDVRCNSRCNAPGH